MLDEDASRRLTSYGLLPEGGNTVSKDAENWLKSVKTVAVIGSGTMGHGMALVFALGGYNVMLNDVNDDILKRALTRIDAALDTFVENDLTTKKGKEQALARINTTSNLASAVEDAHFVIEAVSEILDLKQKIFQQAEAASSQDTILASNTATFPIARISALCQRRDKTVIAHWFNPPYIVPCVEVVKGPETSLETMERTCAILEKVRKKPAKIMKEVPGFVANRMQFALFREAFSIAEKGIASYEDIDTVVKASFGFRQPTLGIFELLDLANLDQVIMEYEEMITEIDCSTKVPEALKRLVAEGKYGPKTGEGFYKWPEEKLKAFIHYRDKQFLRRLKELYYDKE